MKMASTRSRNSMPTSLRAVLSNSTLALIALCPSNSNGACFFSSSGYIGTWPAHHPLLRSSRSMPVSKVVSRDCALELDQEVTHGASYSLLPPSQALLFVNGSAVELPDSCCQGAQEPEARHKTVPAIWQLVQSAANSIAGEVCDWTVLPSHACPKFHPSASNRLVAFEAHFTPAHKLLHRSAFEGGVSTARHQRNLAESAAIDWQPALAEELGVEVIIEAADGFLLIYVPRQELEHAIKLVSQQPLITSITPARTHFLHNAPQLVLPLDSAQFSAGSALSDIDLQLSDAGLKGQGQVIGLGDSGIDMQHCAFSDPAVPFENFKIGEDRIPFFESEEHRKVPLYYMYGDAEDDAQGHGSHVAGIAAGDPPSSTSKGSGVAPGAKIAFFDLGSTTDDTVSVPYDLEEAYFGITYAASARVHTASWGSNAVHYDSDCVAVDTFAASHADFLPVFSAGNFGAQMDTYNTTVNSPALAKNTIAVGNVLPAGYETLLPQTPAVETHLLSFSMMDLPMLEAVVAAADFGGSWQDLGDSQIPLVAANPLQVRFGSCNPKLPMQACSEVMATAPAAGKLVLVERGGCDYDTKVDAFARIGAAGVIVGNTADEFMVVHRSKPSASSVPVASIPQSTFHLLLSFLASGREVLVQSKGKYTIGEYPSFESMDVSSSRGPTLDGRVKPDLVAVGTLQAAQSGSTCGVTLKSGTSMAAPVVAGAAAVVRQYFSDGFYPTGVAGQGPSHEASGALVKAVLIGGAVGMKGYSGGDALPMAVPSPVQGWGRVSLATSLPLHDSQTESKMQVVDLAELSLQGQSHVYCIDAQGGPLSVTLVWQDPPAAPAAEQLLVNDLDLDVRLAALGGLKLHSKGAAQPDRVNNVERVVLQAAPAGHIAITVKAHRLTATSQKYSLVVLGSFDGVLNHEQNPAVQAGQEPEDGACVIQAAEITIHPDRLTAADDPAFGFQSVSGGAPVGGFECRLSSADASGAGLHNWTSCSSPKKYSDLSDGLYTFSVRISGEKVAESYDFEVDITPPETHILQARHYLSCHSLRSETSLYVPLLKNFGRNASSPLAIKLPPASSGQQVAAFAISVTDRSSVDLKCQLSGSGNAAPLSFAPGFALNTEYACTSPQVFSITSAGSYMFSVTGTDSVGNFQQDAVSHSFNVSYPEGSTYSLIDMPVWGATNKTKHSVNFKALVGTENEQGKTVESAQKFQVSVANLSTERPQQQLSWTPTPWADINGSTYVLQVPKDGEYQLRVRAQSTTVKQPVTSWRLTIDSTPPKVTFLAQPPSVMLSDVVVMRVKADEEHVAWQCALLDGDFQSVSTELLKPSCNVSGDGTIEYGGLQDGSMYTSAVRAVDSVGNASPVHIHRFLVDLSAPKVQLMHSVNATRGDFAEFTFAVVDGVAGTSIAAVMCGERWLGNGVAGDTEWVQCEKTDAPDGSNQECEGCSWYTHRIQTPEEGVWGLKVRTHDIYNQTDMRKEEVVVVDRHPPEATWEQSQAPRNPSPPTFTLHVQAVDQGAYKSNLNGALCAVQESGVTADDDFEEQKLADVVLDTPEGGVQDRSRGMMSFVDAQGKTRDGYLGTWYHCSLPVELHSLSSGTYDCSVKPVDWAGNAGQALSLEVTVDESLAPHLEMRFGSQQKSLRSWEVGLIIAAGATIVLAAACLTIWSSKRRQARRSHIHVHEAYTSQGWSADLSADLQAQEQDRIHRALDDSLLCAVYDASKEQYRYEKSLRLATQASLRDRAPS